MSDLPPLKARNERDRKNMEDWVNRELDEIEDALMDWTDTLPRWPTTEKELQEHFDNDVREIYEAEHGNIEPLREKYPRLARFLHLPNQSGPGKRFPKEKRVVLGAFKSKEGGVGDRWHLTQAAWDVPVIKEIWKVHYNGRRLKHYPSAEEIAARRRDVDVDLLHVLLRSRTLAADDYEEFKLKTVRAKATFGA